MKIVESKVAMVRGLSFPSYLIFNEKAWEKNLEEGLGLVPAKILLSVKSFETEA